ncbi:MAG: DUF1924 domain-containing protein [Magnetococcales bacterium]|nr:DUF1924 domain-containing protein [Magnetococcales bacterium]MBF0148433.1 DUF1924 domain-containing protein [Magnetococcales bacterium]MBF0173058.1 DUF1924 domain-containing protein [Magnetococcales bacterium]MBF0346317.1 DUF1924 domain-containing protein [Magnetococcales bacterium]MBF0631711.1 DUF1924 domain-containing protein [Magnetococcales bacterium]
MSTNLRVAILLAGSGLIWLVGNAVSEAADASVGERLWRQAGIEDPEKGGIRHCATCHGQDLRQPGQHIQTGKQIDPMAYSMASNRYGDAEKTEKWFLRNCKWTFGRACSESEKADLLTYLKSL